MNDETCCDYASLSRAVCSQDESTMLLSSFGFGHAHGEAGRRFSACASFLLLDYIVLQIYGLKLLDETEFYPNG